MHANNQGICLAALVTNATKSADTAQANAWVRPDAEMPHVLEHVNEYNLNWKDHVVLTGGINNPKSDKFKSVYSKIKYTVESLAVTIVVFCTVPHRCGVSPNGHIHAVTLAMNKYLAQLTSKYRYEYLTIEWCDKGETVKYKNNRQIKEHKLQLTGTFLFTKKIFWA